MTWQSEADKHVNTPIVLVSVAFNSGTRYYSNVDVETSTQFYKGNILNLPQIRSSVGDIKRTFERSKIRLVFNDSDYEFRGLEDTETVAFKNRTVTIKIGFQDDLFADLLTIFTGNIYDWRRSDKLKYELSVEELSKNLLNKYPDKRVELNDYLNADPSSIGWTILVPYGTISSVSTSNDGAYGHPSLDELGKGGLPLVDNRINQEKTLVGMQAYDELITNGDFTSDVSDWGELSMSTLASVAGGKSGNCLEITGDGASTPGAFQDFTVVPGRWYYTECYVKAGTENEYSLEIYNRDDTSYVYDSGNQTELAGDWSTKEYVLWQAPTGCTTASVFLRHSGGTGAGKTFYFDNVITYEAIYVTNAYIDGTVKVKGSGSDYQISYTVVDNKSHCTIDWETDVNPTAYNRISCDVVFGDRRPVEAIRHFMSNFCEYIDSDFNTAAYTKATDKEKDRGYTFDGVLWEEKRLKAILDEWRDEFELDLFWNKDGEIEFSYLSAFISSVNSYDDVNDILTGFDSDPQVFELLNKLKYGFNYHYSRTYFRNYSTYEDSDSQAKYGETKEKFKGFLWIRSSGIARDIAARKVVRFKDPITFDTFNFPLKTFSEDLTNVVKITHFEGASSSGYIEKLFQVRKINFNIDKYINTVLLEDAANFIGRGCIMGDETLIANDWLTASAAERDYCYLCNSGTGQFSDGEPGKRLFD